MSAFVHPTAVLDQPVDLGDGARVWHFCHVSERASIGAGSSLGQNVFIGRGVRVGNNVKIQNNVSIYEGVTLDDDVFCGPSCVFTNVKNPRSEVVRRGMYAPTLVRRGATLGANATVVAGATVGRFAFVGAGAVVTGASIPEYALMLGVPARQAGWVSRHGHVLRDPDADGIYRCPETAWRYRLDGSIFRCLDWDEERALPVIGRPA